MQTTEEKMHKKIVKEQNKRKHLEKIGKRNQEPNLLAISNAADNYYVLIKLKTYCAYLSYKNIINVEKIPYKESDFKLMKNIIEEIEKGAFQHPMIHIYNQIRLLYQDKAVNFEELIQSIQQLTPKLNEDEGLEIYSFLSNIGIKRLNKGEKSFLKTTFEVYNNMLTLLERNTRKKTVLPTGMFKNIVSIALYLKEDELFYQLKTASLKSPTKTEGFKDAFEWITQFIEVYQKKIDKKTAETYLDYSKALLAFHQEKYGIAYHHLQKNLNTHGLFINMDYKILYLKTVYEMKQSRSEDITTKEINLTIDSYRKLLEYEKNEVQKMNYQQLYYYTFYQVFKQLDSTSYSHKNIQEKQKLKQSIEDIPDFYPFKSWFLEKYQLLQQKK